MNKEDIEEKLAAIEGACRRAGIKLTHQRRLIFTEIAGTEEHPDTESIYKRVKRYIPEISLDTVYRTLRMLHDMGLVQTLGSAGDKIRFDANTKKHHHFVDRKSVV